MDLPSTIDVKLDLLGTVDTLPSVLEAENENGLLAHELCQWICSTEQYKSVINWNTRDVKENNTRKTTGGNTTRHALLISGGQGVNRTALMEAIVQHLSNKANLEISDVIKDDSNAMPWYLSYYSCGRTSHGIDNSTCVLRSLIYSLLRQQPNLITHLDEALDSTQRNHFGSPKDFPALSAIFFRMLDDQAFVQSYLVIDGIDKCSSGHEDGGDNLGDLIRLIEATANAPHKIKWLLSTDIDVGVEFELIRKRKCQCINLEEGYWTPELARIFHQNVIAIVDQLAKQKGYLEQTQKEVSQLISEKSQGNTLWTVIACTILRKEDSRHAVEALKTMPESLDELYEHVGINLKKLPRQDLEYCKSVLSTMAIVYRPLLVSELVRLAGLPSQVDPLAIIEKCSLLEVQSGIVKFIDPAARQDTWQQLRQDLTEFSEAHSLIARRALGFISGHFRTATSPVPASARLQYQKKKERLVDTYGTLHWIMHLLNVKDIAKDAETANLLVSFMKTHFLIWIDTIEPNDLLVDAAVLMNKLESILLKQAREEESELLKTEDSKKPKREILEPSGEKEQNGILSLVQDGIRIVRSHMSRDHIIDTDPNSVIFYPEESALKQDWMAKNKTWLITPPKMAHSWRDSPLTLADWGSVESITFSPDGRFLASGSTSHDIRVRDAETGEVQLTLQGLESQLQHVAFSSNGQLAAFSENGTFYLWDLSTGRNLETYTFREHKVTAIRFSPKAEKGGRLVLATAEALLLWNFSDFSKLPCICYHCVIEEGGPVYAVDFSHQGRWIASGGKGGDIKVWDARHNRPPPVTLRGHEGDVNSVAFSRDEKSLVSGSNDSTVKIWSLETGANLKSFDCAHIICEVAFSPDSSLIAAGFGNQINVWESESGAQRYVMRGHKEPVTAVAFSPQGRLASGSVDGTLRLWDLEGSMGNHMNALGESVRDDRINCMTMSLDGKYLASTSGKNIHLWDGMTGMPTEPHELLQDRVTSISFSPDGKRLVSSSRDGLVRVWDVASRSVYRTFQGHSDWVSFATFSPDGASIASVSDDYTVRIWSCLSEAEGGDVIVLRSHKSYVKTVAFSPDGRLLVSGDNDSNMIIWDRKSLRPKRKVTGHSAGVIDVIFSQDSSRIVSRSDDFMAWVWDSNTGDLIQGPLKTLKPNRYIGFDLGMPEYFLTECGVDPSTLEPSPFPLQEGQKGARYGVAPDGRSITWDGKKIISIPGKYRPTASWVQGNVVAIGTNWGKVLLFRFSTDPQAEECASKAIQYNITQYRNIDRLNYYYLLPSISY